MYQAKRTDLLDSNILLIADKVWEILTPQICKDFHDWENRTIMI